MKNEHMYGAMIERGEITAILEEGYEVKSLSRPGVTTPPIPAQERIEKIIVDAEHNARIEYREYAVGDRVYFFMFDDGKGMVIAAAL